MKVLIIPSWYPSVAFPYTGIFFREQAQILARRRPDWTIGVSTWGSHEPALWVRAHKPLSSMIKLSSHPPLKRREQLLEGNCTEFFCPAFTWTRRLGNGNMKGIMEANEYNLKRFILHFGKPDVIHAHVAYPAGFVAQQLSAKYHIPYLITEHMSPFPMPSFRRDYRQKLLPPMQKAARVLAVSEHLVGRLQHFGIKAQRTSNFIDDSFFTPGDSIPNEKFTYICVGRLEKQKGYDYLLRAVELLNEKGYSLDMKIIGDGTLERKLKATSPANIQWLGACDQTEIRDQLRQADAFVLPSLHENQPVALLEAMACGLPVLTTNWAGADELIQPETGRIVPIGDADALATAMAQQMEGNPPAKGQIRKAFEAFYGTEKCVGELEAVYQNFIA